MAAIDKIYVKSWNEYQQFKEWCSQQPLLEDKYGKKVAISSYLINHWSEEDFSDRDRPIFSASYYVDAYLIRNCPFDFIQDNLKLNYGEWTPERIKSFYEDVVNWDESKQGKCPYWAKKEDFITFEDGTMTIKGLKESSYSQIKRGCLFNSPFTDIVYTAGKHFRCVKHPSYMWNKPFKCKNWFISVNLPDELNTYMWYHKEHNSWDFSEDFVEADSSSSTACCRTIRALKRLIIKWKLPIGTKVTATGRYFEDTYEFIVTK